MQIALVDDDERLLSTLQTMLRTALEGLRMEARQLDCFPSGEALLEVWQPGAYDIIILDIFMNEHSGIDVARKIREQDNDTVLAFCTSSNEFASESYEVGAGYYLQKPVSAEKLTSMLKRLDLSKIERSRVIRLPDGFPCLLRQIIFTEYSNHSVVFHIQGSQPHSVYMSHGEAEKLLLHYRNFCCINKGCIVNFAMVQKITPNAFLMENGETVPISRRRYKEVQEAFTQFRFRQLNEEVSL